jgi:hypothetical protein
MITCFVSLVQKRYYSVILSFVSIHSLYIDPERIPLIIQSILHDLRHPYTFYPNRSDPYTARKLELVSCGFNRSPRIPQSPISMPLRLIKPDLLIQDSNGQLKFEEVALEDVEYATAEVGLKGALTSVLRTSA